MLMFDTFLTKPLVVRGVLGETGDASIPQAVPPKSRGAELTRRRPLPERSPRALPELLTLAASLKTPPEGAKSVAPVLAPGLPGTFGDRGVGPSEQDGRRASRRELERLRWKLLPERLKLDAELAMLLTAAGALPGGTVLHIELPRTRDGTD